MATDLEIIKQLEKRIGKELKQLELDEIITSIDNGYAVDPHGNITGLHLDKNELTEIPAEILQLKNLQVLSLSFNQLTSIPGEIGKLGNLQRLDLRSNQLASIPEEITGLDLEINWEDDYKKGINLQNNPLEKPPVEIVKQGRDAVIKYFKSLEKEGEQPLNEVKVLLVGDGGSGKTSLLKQLIGEGFDEHEPQTHGINIRNRDFKKGEKTINVHFWDFGGQEIMHATHQFFLSKRSLYILVLDGRKEEKIEYWLKHIESFGGDSPVLVVLNKIDENPGFDVNRRFLKKKYNGIEGFYPVSCKKNKGIKNLKENLEKALDDVEIIKTTWPKNWFRVKTQLENIKENFISYEEYQEICSGENIKEDSTQSHLIDFLNDLGVITHFKEDKLEHTQVIEPRWITEGVYKIINSEILANNKGVLKRRYLKEILKQKDKEDYFYPRDKYDFIIDLMKRFELCYKIDENTVLIPDLLEVQEPELDFFDYDNSLEFLIIYDFLPKSVMPHFIVKMNRNIKDDLQWRTGVVLEDKNYNSTAVIKSDNEAKKIYIWVNGKQKRDYFSVLRHKFLSINSNFEKIGEKEMVPCNCPVCRDSEKPHFYDYATLVKFYLKGIREIPCSLSADYVSIDNLLEGLGGSYTSKEEEIIQLLKELNYKSDTAKHILEMMRQAEEDPLRFELGVPGLATVDVKKLVSKLSKKETDKK